MMMTMMNPATDTANMAKRYAFNFAIVRSNVAYSNSDLVCLRLLLSEEGTPLGVVLLLLLELPLLLLWLALLLLPLPLPLGPTLEYMFLLSNGSPLSRFLLSAYFLLVDMFAAYGLVAALDKLSNTPFSVH